MELIKVESSNINAVGYEDNSLIVEYKSGVRYSYKDVPEQVFKDFCEAESKGRFMNESVKGKYEFAKL